MKDNFDELNKALNTASDIVKAEPEEMKIVKSLKLDIHALLLITKA